MASDKSYLDFVLDLLSDIPSIHYKKMMGEFLLYQGDVLFGGIYDNRFLIKKSKSSYQSDFKEVIPYPNAKPMLLIDIEDKEEITRIIHLVVEDLR